MAGEEAFDKGFPTMSFDSILVPHDGSPEAAKALGCAAWLAPRLRATLHVLESSAEPASDLLAAIDAHQAKLVVMTARGASASAGVEPGRRMGRAGEVLIRESTVPVVLLPVHYREALPWTSMLVAASGEPAADQALEAALQLATALGLELDVFYCESPRTKAQALGEYADAVHHEYGERLQELVRRAAARRPAEERGCIGQVLLCRGDPADELLAQVAQRRAGVVALGWHGTLGAGRALLLKRLLDEAECPLLLVRHAARPASRLKVGEELQRAAG